MTLPCEAGVSWYYPANVPPHSAHPLLGFNSWGDLKKDRQAGSLLPVRIVPRGHSILTCTHLILISGNIIFPFVQAKCHFLISPSRPCALDAEWWSGWNQPLACCVSCGLYQVQNSSSLHVWETGGLCRNLYKRFEE